MAIGAKPKASL